ncbi:MAG: YhdP family protein [Gammaproteobacteria bacterium]
MHVKRWQQIAWRWLAGVLAFLALAVLLAAGLFRTLAPVVPVYRAEAEAYASRVLGRPVSIASMGAQWGLYGPELTLDDVEIYSHDRRRVLIAARQIRLGFTPAAILHTRFARPNRIVLMAPYLTLQRDLDGHYDILGLEGSTVGGFERTGWRQAARELFAQEGQILVREGTVTFVDLRAPATALAFTAIRMNVNNTRDRHRLSGSLHLPEQFGRTLTVNLQVLGTSADPETWEWQVEGDGEALVLPRLLAYWPAYDGRLRSGVVNVFARVHGDGRQVRSADLSLQAQQIAAAGSAPSVDRLAVNLTWAGNAHGWTLAGRNLELRRGTDVWPVSRFDLEHVQTAAGGSSWEGAASFLRLQDLVLLGAWLPADEPAILAPLTRLAPAGDLHAVKFAVTRAGAAVSSWALDARFQGLTVHADGKVPGFSGLSGTLTADQDDGQLVLAGRDASVSFPHLFRGPLMLSRLSAALDFHHDAQGWHFDLRNLSASNPDVAQATASGTLLLPAAGGSPTIDLRASAEHADARNKSAYFPVGIMPKEVIAWLDRAIVAGQVSNASLVLQGKLHDFPYAQGPGLFDIRFHLQHGRLDYADGWPPLTGIDAEVEFKNQGMQVTVQHARLLDDDVAGASARFADLRNGLLEIQGMARGTAGTALAFLAKGPLADRFAKVLDGVQVSGTAAVHLNLQLPVQHPEQYVLDANAQLTDVGVTMAGLAQWPVTGLHGRVNITQNGVSAKGLQGEFLGAPLSMNLARVTGHDATRIHATGGAQAADLAAALPKAFGAALSGTAEWQLDGRLPSRPGASTVGLALTLSSNMQGLGVGLPAPFSKPASAVAPLVVAMALGVDGAADLHFNYNDLVNAIAKFTPAKDGWHFERGELALGGGLAALPPVAGLKISGRLPEFSLSAWQALLPANSAARAALSPALFSSADVSLGEFSGFGQDLKNLHFELARGADAWNIALTSPAVTGTIAWPYHVDVAHPIVADLQRLDLVRKSAEERKGPALQLDPRKLPALRLTARQLRYNDAHFENLHAELTPVPDGVELKSLSIDDPSFKLNASGDWLRRADGSDATSLKAELKSTNVERTLEAFGYAPGISGNDGELTAELHWPGGPLAEILPNLGGKLHVVLRHGSLLDVKPGAGRIFGLLSINALPRRLLFNFRDVLGKGFAFDTIEGNFTLRDGDAYTPDLTIRGPAAKIQMVGRTGLVSHDFDEAVVVTPSVGSTLPVLGALAGGVGVGAVVFLITEIFKKPLSQVGETRYHLSGTWDNPKLTVMPAPAAPAAKSSQ